MNYDEQAAEGGRRLTMLMILNCDEQAAEVGRRLTMLMILFFKDHIILQLCQFFMLLKWQQE
jgi:hypothetical protein